MGPGALGAFLLLLIAVPCVVTLPWTLGVARGGDAGGEGARSLGVARYNAGDTGDALVAPLEASAGERSYLLGSDRLGRSVLIRSLTGGGISLAVGLAAAVLSVTIGTLWGAIAAYAGGRTDAVMMRIVDVLYGLPYVLLVVLLAVASDAVVEEYAARTRERAAWVDRELEARAEARPMEPAVSRGSEALTAESLLAEALAAVPPRRISAAQRSALDVATLLFAIGAVSWLTLARVVRGEVMSLRTRAYVDAARVAGAGPVWIFTRHLLPGLVGPIVVYGTLTVPQAILQESFLSFLGIGIKPPLPSWGNMAADGLSEVNTYKSHWWLLAVPTVLLAVTLVAMNLLGEGLRRATIVGGSERAEGGGA